MPTRRRSDPGAAGPIAAGVTFVVCLFLAVVVRPARETFGADLALILMVLTVGIASWLGTFSWGIYCGLIGALFFDFFFTQPYESLRIESGADILRTAGLAVLGAASGGLASWRRSRDREPEIPHPLHTKPARHG